MTKHIVAGLALTTGLALHSGATEDRLDPRITRGPYLQMAGPSFITVVWRTSTNIHPVVRYGETPESLTQQVGPEGVVTKVSLGATNASARAWLSKIPGIEALPQLHSAPAGTFQYEVQLTELKPATRYFYAVYDGEQRLTPKASAYHFRTQPLPGQTQPVRFWVVGDSGTGRRDQIAVYEAMLDWVQREKRPLDFYMHVGDMAYHDGRDTEFQTRFFDIYQPTLRHLVCWPTMGNHEGHTSRGINGVGPYYDAYVVPTRGEVGGVASGTEAYYAFDFGRVHFICLDSHDLDRKPTGAMARWLRADLDRAQADWLIAFWHHPPYTKGTHDSDKENQLIEMRAHIMPILESAGVDLVLTGHSHIYERSMLMDGAYATPTVATGVILDDGDGRPDGDGPYRKSAGLHPHEGTVQVVAGHGGAHLGRKGTMPVMREIIVEYGSVIVEINGDTLTALMLDRDGRQRDLFSIVKRGQVTVQRVENPWQPAPLPGGKEFRPPSPYVEPAVHARQAIPSQATWQYLTGDNMPSGLGWTRPGYAAEGWREGAAPFGYGYDQVKTTLPEMQGRFTTVYLRRTFHVAQADRVTELGLLINYDDAFIAYLNGHEVLRRGVKRGNGRAVQGVQTHEAEKPEYVVLRNFARYLRDGQNVLAIEGHNVKPTSSDFLLDPVLFVEE